mgnify:CR=1 FL=1
MDKKNKNINNTLNGFSKKESPFAVPENYFNTVEDTILSKIILNQLPGELTYNVPENYFTKVEEDIFKKLSIKEQRINKVVSLKSRLLRIIPTAAAACLLLFIGLNYFSINSNSSFDNISSDDIENWLDENYTRNSTINTLEFVDADFTEETTIEDESSIADDDILEYLNTIDSTGLLTEIES